MLHGEEPLLAPGVDSIAAQRSRKADQILPLLAAAGITLGVATKMEGLTAFLTLHARFLPNSSRTFNRWLKPSHPSRTSCLLGSGGTPKSMGARSYS